MTASLFTAFCAASAWAAEPAVVWVSQPVAPGEAVMVYGGPWTNVTAVEVDGTEKRTVSPLKVTDDCVTFVYPKEWPLAAFSARVASGGGTAELRVNAPDVWWLQGDAGKSATPGGWLRAYGRSVGYGGTAFLELRDRAGKAHKLPAKESDLYALRVELAKDFPAGAYEVFLNNGLDGRSVPAGNVEVAPQREPWPEKVFDVTAYGAVANDGNDDARAIRAALADIAKNSGGVLYFPRGRFGMRGELALPPNTLLRGAGMALTQLYWLDEDDPKGALLSGTRDFGVEEIFLAAANIDDGIVVTKPAEGDAWKNANVLLRRVRARFLHTDTTSGEESFRRSRSGGMPFRVGGDFVRVIGCDFYFSKGESSLHGDFLFVAGNRFDGPGCGYLGGRNVIFEDNNHEGRGMSFANGSRCVYLKGNRLGGVYGDGDRETFTFDGGDATYSDTAVSASGKTLKLKPCGWRHGVERWIGEPVYIVGGRGAGQMRFITRIEGQTVTIDRPWDVAPDAESYFSVAVVRSRLLFVDNSNRDGNPFALYGSACDVVLSGNTLERTGGLHAHGMYKGVPEPCWFVQFLGNQVLEGNAVRGPFSYVVPASDSWIGFFDRGIKRPLTYPQNRVGVMRRNVLHGNAFLDAHGRVKGLLMENNLVKNADRGAVIESSVQDALLRGNRFENVTRPLVIHDQVQVGPADRLSAGLSAAQAALQTELPDTWKGFVAEAGALSAKALPEAEEAQAAAGILARAVRALSVRLGDRPAPPATVSALLGINLAQNSPWFLGRIASGQIGSVKTPMEFPYPAWGLPATLSSKIRGIDGWQIAGDPAVKLVPGKKAGYTFHITRPGRQPVLCNFAAEYTVAGEGWSLRFEEKYAYDALEVAEFLVAGLFKNRSGKGVDTEVHPPELRLDVTQSYDTLDGKRPWVMLKADEKGAVDMCKVFTNTEVATAHAVAVVRAARPLQVKVEFGSNQNNLLCVNGERVGSSARRDAVGGRAVDLRQGDNLIQLISSHASGAWPLKVSLTAVDSAQPDDLRVIPAEELAALPLLAAQGEKIPEGKALPESMGIDWKLVYSDDFNRLRVSGLYEGRHPLHWPDRSIRILDGTLVGAARIALKLKAPPPVRVEYDVPAVNRRARTWLALAPEGASAVIQDWQEAFAKKAAISMDKVNGAVPGDTAHVVAVFTREACRLSIGGRLCLEVKDTGWVGALDELTFSGTIDNLRIYMQR